MKWIFHPLAVITLTIVSIILVYSLQTNTKEIKKSTERIDILDQENQKLATEIFQLEEQLEQARSDFLKEKIVRNELLLQKPGEYIVQIDIPATSSAQKNIDSELTPWQKWQQVLF